MRGRLTRRVRGDLARRGRGRPVRRERGHLARRGRGRPVRRVRGDLARRCVGISRAGCAGILPTGCMSVARASSDTIHLLLLLWGKRVAYSGRFFENPLRFFSRFGHQNAPTPPSPLCGRRGQRASGRPNSPFAPLWEKGAKAHQDAPTPPSPRVGEGGWGEEGAKAHQDAPTPPSPRVGEGGWGDEGQTDTGTPLPLSALSSPHAGQGDTLDEEAL
jgi:hypothetical protein